MQILRNGYVNFCVLFDGLIFYIIFLKVTLKVTLQIIIMINFKLYWWMIKYKPARLKSNLNFSKLAR
jgi:hypothetical protein